MCEIACDALPHESPAPKAGPHTIISFIDRRSEAEKITETELQHFGARFFFVFSHCSREKKANQGVESSANGITTLLYFLWPWDRGNSTQATDIFEVVPASSFIASFLCDGCGHNVIASDGISEKMDG